MGWVILAILLGFLVLAGARNAWHSYQDRRIRAFRRRMAWREYRNNRR
jgi:hypothetical protein